jgi:hypothetical protein
MGAWNLALARLNKKKLAAAVIQLDGSVYIWHMIDWVLTACCLYGASLKNEHAHYKHQTGGRSGRCEKKRRGRGRYGLPAFDFRRSLAQMATYFALAGEAR